MLWVALGNSLGLVLALAEVLKVQWFSLVFSGGLPVTHELPTNSNPNP